MKIPIFPASSSEACHGPRLSMSQLPVGGAAAHSQEKGAMFAAHVCSIYLLLCYVMLCYVVLCFVMLCYIMSCCVVLCLDPETAEPKAEAVVGPAEPASWFFLGHIFLLIWHVPSIITKDGVNFLRT